MYVREPHENTRPMGSHAVRLTQHPELWRVCKGLGLQRGRKTVYRKMGGTNAWKTNVCHAIWRHAGREEFEQTGSPELPEAHSHSVGVPDDRPLPGLDPPSKFL